MCLSLPTGVAPNAGTTSTFVEYLWAVKKEKNKNKKQPREATTAVRITKDSNAVVNIKTRFAGESPVKTSTPVEGQTCDETSKSQSEEEHDPYARPKSCETQKGNAMQINTVLG